MVHVLKWILIAALPIAGYSAYIHLIGDCITSGNNITCTKTNGVSFATSATTDTTNASNITSGTLSGARLATPTTSSISASAIDWSICEPYALGCMYTKTLGANTTFTWSNVTAGQTINIAVTNTASNWTLTWPAAAKWSGGSAPTQTTGAHTDVYTCISYDGTNAYCSAVQNF